MQIPNFYSTVNNEVGIFINVANGRTDGHTQLFWNLLVLLIVMVYNT